MFNTITIVVVNKLKEDVSRSNNRMSSSIFFLNSFDMSKKKLFSLGDL